jgi:hypothetical protein
MMMDRLGRGLMFDQAGNPSRGESRLDARFRGHDSLMLKTAKRKGL